MRTWTVHLRRNATPALVREGFSWGAFFFGWIWLLAHRAWIAAALWLAGTIVVIVLTPAAARPLVGVAIAVLQGLFGNDLRRWSLERRGFALAHVVAARDSEGALVRLLDRRPDLAETFAR
ncbi:MAG: DUF2628 domain-containing protein [Acetobacteraceae bacterium]|nr:DUF2628 domain-containing protein [Acetobacteraceae bacterium]